MIRGPVLPLSHYSSNNTASGLSEPPPRPTSKPHNHPGVQRMPLQSCISSPSLLVINESVSDSFRMSLYSLFSPHTHTHTHCTPLVSSHVCHSVGQCSDVSASSSQPLPGWRRTAGGPSESRLQGEGYREPTVKLLIDWLLKWTGIIRWKVKAVLLFFTTINLLYKSCQWMLLKM